MTSPHADLTDTGRAFCRRYNLTPDSLIQPDLPVIELMAQGMASFEHALGRACSDNVITVEEPTWGMVRAMILRGFAHADAGFVCLASGSVATAEVVSRVVVESALNVLYILKQDRVGRLYDYLASFVARSGRSWRSGKRCWAGCPLRKPPCIGTRLTRKNRLSACRSPSPSNSPAMPESPGRLSPGRRPPTASGPSAKRLITGSSPFKVPVVSLNWLPA